MSQPTFWAVLGVVALATALALAFSAGGSHDAFTPHKWVSADSGKDCAARGGHLKPFLEPFGKLQRFYCIRPLADGGKVCSRKSDCLGYCLVDLPLTSDKIGPSPRSDKATPGRCQSEDRPLFGCFTLLDDQGRLVEVCVD